MMRHDCLVVLAVLSLIPTASADGIESVAMTFHGPAEATARSHGVYPPEAALHLRRSMDSDGDGNVTARELEAFEASFRRFVARDEGAPSSEIVGADYLLDDAWPSADVEHVVFMGALGAVDADHEVTLDITVVYSWTLASGPVHRLTVEVDGPGETEPPADIRFVITAPDGYRVDDDVGTLSADHRTVTVPLSLQADAVFLLTMRPIGDEEASAMPVGPLLGLLWVAVRRSRSP